MVLVTISRIITVQLPAYLKKLPLPETIGGFARLTGTKGAARCTDGPAKMTSALLTLSLIHIYIYIYLSIASLPSLLCNPEPRRSPPVTDSASP